MKACWMKFAKFWVLDFNAWSWVRFQMDSGISGWLVCIIQMAATHCASKSNYPLRLCFIFDKKTERHINEFELLDSVRFRRLQLRLRLPRNYLSRACHSASTSVTTCCFITNAKWLRNYLYALQNPQPPNGPYTLTVFLQRLTRKVRVSALDKIMWRP